MKLGLVGVGEAGGRIVNQIRKREKETNREFSEGNILVFDTTASDRDLEEIPYDQCIAIGDTNPKVRGQGVEGDPELAVEVTREELYDIRRVFDFISIHELNGILLVAGLGGGTGSGMGTVLLDELQKMYEKPIYALGVLPSEAEGGGPALNAARSLQSFVRTADNVILFDNETWHSVEHEGDADEDADEDDEYETVNRELATRITSVLAAGELDGATIAENAIDSSDIMRTLDTGGVSSIGYASLDVDMRGFLSRLYHRLRNSEDEEATDPTEIKRLVRQAVHSKLTLPCNVASTERTLIVLSGPASKLSRRGFESARYWLEQETDTVEVLAGDEPNKRSSTLTATVLLSNVSDVPRIDALQEQAVAHQERLAEEPNSQ